MKSMGLPLINAFSGLESHIDASSRINILTHVFLVKVKTGELICHKK
jgi:hypothetical protein